MRRISSVLRAKPIPSLISASSLIDASRKATSWSTNGRARRRIRWRNPSGQPFYRDLDPRDFAAMLGDLGVDPIVTKVVAHVASEAVLRRWIRESVEDHRFRNFGLVGGNSSRARYPGPSVVEANRILRTLTKGRDDIALGNITIAERDRKSTRLNSSHRCIS